MKQNYLIKARESKGSCDSGSCEYCADCKVVNFEEKRMELKSSFSQLYAKEAEHYFFYYGLNLKQGS